MNLETCATVLEMLMMKIDFFKSDYLYVLVSFSSSWHKLASSGETEIQFRKTPSSNWPLEKNFGAFHWLMIGVEAPETLLLGTHLGKMVLGGIKK